MSSDECYTTNDERKKRRKVKSPDKDNTQEGKFDKILEALGNLTQEIKELKMEQREFKLEQKEFKEEIRKIKQENEIIKKENVELKKDIKTINEKLDALEKEKRRNNVVIQGINIGAENQKEIVEELKKFTKVELGVDVEIKEVRKMGIKTCLMELANSDDKAKVMKNKNKLRSNKEQIFINDDMSKKERIIQGKIRRRAQEEKRKGHSVKIGFLKLIINDEVWKWDEVAEEFKIFKETPKN
jgi:hypothetical protein